MFNVVLLSQFFLPETNSASNRISTIAGALHDRFQLTVVTLRPSYPTPDQYSDADFQRLDGSAPYLVLRGGKFHPHAGSFAVRAVREIWMALKLGALGATAPCQLVVVSTPCMFLVPAGWLLARSRRAAFVVDVRDITWRYARESEKISGKLKPLVDVLEWVMNFALRRADHVFTTTEGFQKTLLEAGVAGSRLTIVPNGIAREFLEALLLLPEPSPAPQRRLKVVYAGVIGHNQGVGVLIEVARAVQARNIDVVFVGEGPDREALQQQVAVEGLSNVSFTGYVDRDALIRIYSQSDIFFAQLKDTPSLNDALPTKLFEYMAAGRPIVYAGKGKATAFLGAIGSALIVTPGDADAITRAIVALATDAEQAHAMALKGRMFVRQNDPRETLVQAMADVLVRIKNDVTR